MNDLVVEFHMIKSSKDLCTAWVYSTKLSKGIMLPTTVSCAVTQRQDKPAAKLPNAWPEIPPPTLLLPGLWRYSVLSGHCKGNEFKKAQHRYKLQVTFQVPGGPQGDFVTVLRSHFNWASEALLLLPEGEQDVDLYEGQALLCKIIG